MEYIKRSTRGPNTMRSMAGKVRELLHQSGFGDKNRPPTCQSILVSFHQRHIDICLNGVVANDIAIPHWHRGLFY